MATTELIGEKRKGSVDDVTFYQRNGQTIVRKKHRSGRVARSGAAMEHKTKWSNTLNCWRKIGPLVKGNFEQKRPGQTDYNLFMSINMRKARVFLTKEEAGRNRQVADRFTLSFGTLQPVEVREVGNYYVSSIPLGPYALDENSTMADIVCAMTNGVEDRDMVSQLNSVSFYRVWQDNDLWRIGVQRVDLDYGCLWDKRTQRELFGGALLLSVDGCLATPKRKNTLVCWVLRHTDVEGRECVSTQSLVGDNELVPILSDESQLLMALNSYGGVTANYARPTRNENYFLNYMIAKGKAQPVEEPKEMRVLTVDCLPPGSGEMIGSGAYALGSVARVAAAPEAGWRFLCWGDACTELVREVRVEKDAVLTALFAREE